MELAVKEAVISKNFQYKKIFQNLEQIQPKREITHQYMLPKLHPVRELSQLYIYIHIIHEANTVVLSGLF